MTFDDLLFQLFYRDLLTDEIKEQVNQEPNILVKNISYLALYKE